MRLIDADAFKDYIREACEDLAPLFNDNGKVARLVTENFCKDIDEQPTVFAEPKRAKWIATTALQEGQITWRDYKCSNCSHHRGKPMNFCEVCGAKMERVRGAKMER